MAFYRPIFRTQKPAVDPREPQGGEGLAVGNSHGWSGCTATSAAMALDYHTHGRKRLWGGQIRHALANPNGSRPGPMLGLDDIKLAWTRLGYDLLDWSGRGWDDVVAAHNAGRGIILQGTGNTPGVGTYTGAHACYWNPDDAWGDPLASKWQKVAAGTALDRASIRAWAQRFNGNISFAVTRRRTS